MNASRNNLNISSIRTTAGHFLVNINGSTYFFVTGLTGTFLGKSSQAQWKEIKGESKLEATPERIVEAVKLICDQIHNFQTKGKLGYAEIFEKLSPTAEAKQKLYSQEAVKAYVVPVTKTRVIPQALQLRKKVKVVVAEKKPEEIQVVVEKPSVAVLGKIELPKKLQSGNPVVRKHQQQVVAVKTEAKAEVKQHQPVAVKKIVVTEKPAEKKNQQKPVYKKQHSTHHRGMDEEQVQKMNELNSQPKGTSLGDILAAAFAGKGGQVAANA